MRAEGASRPGLRHRGAAVLLQNPSALLPRLGIEDVKRPVVIQLHSGDDLDPELDAPGVAGDRSGYRPEPRRAVLASRERGLAVGAEGHSLDGTLVVQGLTDGYTIGGAPEPRRAVLASREHGLAVGAEGH